LARISPEDSVGMAVTKLPGAKKIERETRKLKRSILDEQRK
jgi:hypothetical protein